MEYISAVIGKNPKAVEAILGPSEKVEFAKLILFPKSIRAYYQNGEVEIVFIDNVADWIRITKNNGMITSFIDLFEVYKLKPSNDFPFTLVYKNVAGIKEITFVFASIYEIEYINVKAFTE